MNEIRVQEQFDAGVSPSEHATPVNTGDNEERTRLLFLGPSEGPIGGALSLFQSYAEIFSRDPRLDIEVINTAPPPDYRAAKRTLRTLVNGETVTRTGRILRQFSTKIGKADVALVFTNNHFSFALIPPMVAIAHAKKKPIYLKTIGGDLDVAIAGLKPPLRQYVLKAFRSLDGILAETQLLKNALEAMGCDNVYYIPNCRSQTDQLPVETRSPAAPGELRAIFLSQIHEDKGVFVLLDALQRLEMQTDLKVMCDFYGPIFPATEEAFRHQLGKLNRAEYQGVLPIGAAPGVLAAYDVLVLPTHYIHEGHPGILIEAMQAGTAVISTQHRAIPELVTDGVDGLLVPPRDPDALAEALTHLARHPEKVAFMGAAHADRFVEFSSERVIETVSDIIRSQIYPE